MMASNTNHVTEIDLENGDSSPLTRVETTTTSGRRNITKVILAVAGVAGVAAIGAVTSSGSNYNHETGYTAAATSRMLAMLEATLDAEPTATDTLIGAGMATPAYLSVDGFEKCVAEESVGTSTQYCIPQIRPSACIEKSWGSLAAENMGIFPCAAKASPIHNPEQQPDKPDQYKLDMDSYLKDHKAEVDKFLADNKDAIGDIQPEIEQAIIDETFDFEHYKEQLQKILDEHDMKDYKDKFQTFMDKNQNDIDDFILENKQAVSDVQDRIADSIKVGDFDFEHYKEVIQEYVDEFDMAKYKTEMDDFVSKHQDAIKKFVNDNKDAVSDVMGQITDRVNSGSFDFENYKQEIQDLVTDFDLNNNINKDDLQDSVSNTLSAVQDKVADKVSTVQDKVAGNIGGVTGSTGDATQNKIPDAVDSAKDTLSSLFN
jgi:hypothetical protein